MVAAGEMNPNPLPRNILEHLDEYPLEDLAMAIHRSESAVNVETPLFKKYELPFF